MRNTELTSGDVVNSAGHEILFQNVSQVTFTILNNAVKVKVTTYGEKNTPLSFIPLLTGMQRHEK